MKIHVRYSIEIEDDDGEGYFMDALPEVESVDVDPLCPEEAAKAVASIVYDASNYMNWRDAIEDQKYLVAEIMEHVST